MEKRKKRWGDRRDGVWLRDLDALHAFTPYLFPNRADNEAFIEERVDITRLNEYLEKKNAGNPEYRYTFFHVFLAALVKTITLRPKMNRFIQGSRMYMRNELTLSFVVKKQFEDNAHEALAFLSFPKDSTIDTVHDAVMKEIHTCRSDALDNSTAGMDTYAKIPRGILRVVMWFFRRLDYYGKMPYSLIKTDPNYATCFISNLGSIKLKAGYHHLTNWGTTSIFAIIGQKKMSQVTDENGQTVMHETLDIGLTLDERIADGYYYSKTVRLLKHLLNNPELLELPADTEVEY